jgi:hypothetical protein
MKYEKPELTVLTDAIRAIQTSGSKLVDNPEDAGKHISTGAYEDNE